MDEKTFSVPVPVGTEKLTIVIRKNGGETILDILVVESSGTIEIEHPIFETVLER